MEAGRLDPHVRIDWAKRVRERRESLRLTQMQAAARAGTHQGTWSRLEANQLEPSDDLKWRVAGALACTIPDLFPYPSVRPPAHDVATVGESA